MTSEKQRGYQKRYYEKNKERINARNNKYNREHKEERAEWQRRYYAENKEKIAWWHKDYYEKNRQRVYSHYCGGEPHCVCCGETRMEFLTIHHENGGGNEHRKKVGFGTAFYKWIIKNGFPDGYSVLCMNCNHALGRYGFCPHKKEATQQKD